MHGRISEPKWSVQSRSQSIGCELEYHSCNTETSKRPLAPICGERKTIRFMDQGPQCYIDQDSDGESHCSDYSYFLPTQYSAGRSQGRQYSTRDRTRTECRHAREEMQQAKEKQSKRNHRKLSSQMYQHDLSPLVLFWAMKIDSFLCLLQSIVEFVLSFGSIRITSGRSGHYGYRYKFGEGHDLQYNVPIGYGGWSDPELAEKIQSCESDYPVYRNDNKPTHEVESTVGDRFISLNSKRPTNRRPPLGRIHRLENSKNPTPTDEESCSEGSYDDDVIGEFFRRGKNSRFPPSRGPNPVFPKGTSQFSAFFLQT